MVLSCALHSTHTYNLIQRYLNKFAMKCAMQGHVLKKGIFLLEFIVVTQDLNLIRSSETMSGIHPEPANRATRLRGLLVCLVISVET